MDRQVAGSDDGKIMGPAEDRSVEVHYIPLMAIIPGSDLYFAMRYWEHPSYQRVREGIEEEARRTLYISNLPTNLRRSVLLEFLWGYKYLRSQWEPGDLYVPVVFETLEEAMRAYKELEGRKLGNSAVWLSWKTPNTIVYIMNIKHETQSPRIRKLLQGYRLYGDLVRRPHMMIASFWDREEAEIAVNRLQGTNVDGELLQFSVLRGQHASEFVGYERSLSCYMCLRTLQSGARVISITATPPLPLTLAVESPIYSELSFNLGDIPQIILNDSRVLPTVTSRDIALRTRCAGRAAVKQGPHGGANHFLKFMEILRGDISDCGGIMDIGIILEDPLDALKIETFFGGSVPPASRVVPEMGGESQSYRRDTVGESSGVGENWRRGDNALYSSALNKPGPLRRASVGSTSNIPPWLAVDGVPLGGGNREPKPHDSVNTEALGRQRVLPIGVTKPEHPSPSHTPPNPRGSSRVSAFSDPQLKARQFPFFSTQPTSSIIRPLAFGQRQPGSQLSPGGGENTMGGLRRNSGNGRKGLGSGKKGLGNGKGVVVAVENQRVDAPPKQMDGRDNGLLLPETQIQRSSSDSPSSSWSFLHQEAPPPSSPASIGSAAGSVARAFGQMQYTDDSDSETTDAALAKIVDLTVDNGKERGRSGKSGNPGRERRKIPIVDSSDSDRQSELGSRAAKTRPERSTQKKKKSKRKEKVPSGESMASKSGEEPPVVQRRKHKSGKKGKGKEIAHSDESPGSKSDRDEPGPSKPRKKSSGRAKFPQQVESVSDCKSLAPPEVKKKKKKKKAKEVEEVQEGSDVDMDASDPSAKRIRKERRGHQSRVSGSKDSTQPLTKGISETRTARRRSVSQRPEPPADTSSSDPKTKKRKRNRTSSPSPTPPPIPSPPADLSPSPIRPGESMDTAFRRREIQEKIHRINLQQHELLVRESGLKHELKKLKYQARVEADVQGLPYVDCMCSACGEYGHNKRNRAKCKKHPKYVDWYPDR